MDKPLYKNEQTLFWIAAIISALFWGIIAYSSAGAALAVLPVFFIFYLFLQSGFICYLKGTGALISADQFPDIDARVQKCAQILNMEKVPTVFLLNGDGLINAFATRFLNKNYIILLSDALNALEETPEAINFYIGHEMGHLDRKHLIYQPLLAPALILPLLGAAYSRAREYTCDQYGLRCCPNFEVAQKALALLAVGPNRYKQLNIKTYLNQVRVTSGFWMSLHELIASYPWLTKRVARVAPEEARYTIPNRNAFAYIFALFVPRLSILSFIIIYMAIIFSSAASLGDNVLKTFDKTAAQTNNFEEDHGYAEDAETPMDRATKRAQQQANEEAYKALEEQENVPPQPALSDEAIEPYKEQ